MNKKEAIAYAQIALNYIQSSKINPKNLGFKMKQAFRLYTKDIATIMANSIVETEQEFRNT